MKSRQNFSQRTHPIYPIGPRTHVLGRFGLFCYCMNFGAKRAELVQLTHKFVQRSRVGIFHNEPFRTVLLMYELRRKLCRTGAISAQVRATKSHQNFSQRTHPIHPIGLKLIFWGVSDRFVTAPTSVQNVPNWSN
jgi:hypothetical protein